MKKIIFVFYCFIVLTLSLRGLSGSPSSNTINNTKWRGGNSPFELSPERGRFALTLSLVENKSFYFSTPLARFAIPDLGYKNNHYVSLFAPGVSFVIMPGYLLGQLFDLAQVGAFAMIALFALLNVLLIRAIALRLKIPSIAAYLGGLSFLFATPAYVYAVSLFQHHISTFLLLLSLYVVLRFKSIRSLGFVWFLIASSFLIDYPNIFLLLPIGIYGILKMINIQNSGSNTVFSFKLVHLLTFATVIFPLIFFMWFNQGSYNNPFQLSGTVKSVKEIDSNGNPVSAEELSKRPGREFELFRLNRTKTVTGFFKTRYMLNGFYIHFFSPDRGLIWFSPIIFFSVFGAVLLYKRNRQASVVLLSIIGLDVVLYSMWGDPWGGWAFGSRYLVPAYAISAILIAQALTLFKRKILVLILFAVVLGYSVFVSELGAITTSANPPQVEALELSKLSGKEESYTWQRNLNFLLKNHSKSFIWQVEGHKYLQAYQYYLIIYGVIFLPMLLLIFKLRRQNHD